MKDCVSSLRIGLRILTLSASSWVIFNICEQKKKEGSMCGTKPSPTVTRERPPCFIPFFRMSSRLLNLTTPGGTPQPLGSYARCQGFDRIFLNLPVAEARDFHCYSHVSENLGNQSIPSDHAAVRIVIQKPSNQGQQCKRIPSWMSIPFFVLF